MKKHSKVFHNIRAPYWLLKGQYAKARGRNGHRAFQKSLDVAQGFNSTFDEAKALAALGEEEANKNDTLSRARELFLQLGQTAEAESVSRLLAAS